MKRLLNATIVVILLTLIPFLSGCDAGNTQQNLNIMKATIQQVTAGIEIFDSRVVEAEEHLIAAEAVLRQAKELLEDPNLTVPAKEEALAMIDEALAVKAKAMEARVKWDTMREIARSQIAVLEADIAKAEEGGSLPGEDLIILGRGISSVGQSLPAPIGPILGVLGAVIAAIGEARRRASEKVARGVVASVDVVLDGKADRAPMSPDEMKAVLKETQRKLGVRAGVKKLLDT